MNISAAPCVLLHNSTSKNTESSWLEDFPKKSFAAFDTLQQNVLLGSKE